MHTSRFLWLATKVPSNAVPLWLLQVRVSVRVHWGYSAPTALCGSSLWSSCNIPLQNSSCISHSSDCIIWDQISWSEESGCVVVWTCLLPLRGYCTPGPYFWRLCIFSKNKATLDKVSYGSGQKCSKELKNHSFTSIEAIVLKLQWKMCENQYFPCFES